MLQMEALLFLVRNSLNQTQVIIRWNSSQIHSLVGQFHDLVLISVS